MIDTWTTRAEAHRELKEPWTGSTSYFLKHNQGTDGQFEGQRNRQPEKGYADMYHCCNDCVFSCDTDSNGVDSWLSTLSDTRVAAASAVSVSRVALKGVISESRGAAASAVSEAAMFSSVAMSDIYNE